nr:transglutaminase domain-containing protein [uncultured Caproiciproducens sp.]
MIFSQELQDSIHRQFLKMQPTLGLCGKELLTRINDCKDDRRTALEFFYSTMPAADLGDYDFSLYLKFVDFGLFLAENSTWSSQIPENIFLNYVLYYRINNEAIEDCRAFFYHALKDRISGKSMKEAALEVNIWCAEHVTYQATDERTVSPLTALKSSYARCGEESTFAVTAMRSVGIPARQVYTPRWAHCDDNHAWVEVWCDGQWYFLGACEPEPVLNRGWFTEAAARSMLMDSKSFLPIEGEEMIGLDGQTMILNELSRYAEARRFTVTVVNPEPLSGVTVQFELLNGAEFSPIASAVTDETGKAGVTLGLGSIHIHAVKDGRFAEAFADTEEADCVTIDFSQAVQAEPDAQEAFSFRAPKDSSRNLIQLTPEQKELRKRVTDSAGQKRLQYVKGFYKKGRAEKLAAKFSRPQDIIALLKAAEGNFQELYDFLSMDFGAEKRDLQLQMLQSLQKKDYRDISAALLAEQFRHSLNDQNEYPPELFVPYILCPRAHYEQLVPYSVLLAAQFDEQSVAAFRKQPKRVWDYVSRFQSAPERNSERLTGTPAGMIRSGQANEMGRRVLFTAICRTLGIPARVNPVDLSAQYYQNGTFRNAQELPDESSVNSALTLLGGTENWSYLHNWTIAVLKDGVYQTLEFTDSVWADGKLVLSLMPGSYRLVTSSRTPNGNQFAKKYCFSLSGGETKDLAISLCRTQVTDLLQDIPLPSFHLCSEQKKPVPVGSVIDGKTAVLVWLEEGREPTEHILNEFLEAQSTLNSIDCELIFIIRDRSAWDNETFAKACRAIPGARVYYSDFTETAVTMARRMFVDPEKLPLTIVARGCRGVYACSGYNVGIVDLLTKIITVAE